MLQILEECLHSERTDLKKQVVDVFDDDDAENDEDLVFVVLERRDRQFLLSEIVV